MKNKGFILTTALLLLQCATLFSQNMSKSPTYGFKAGVLMSTVTGDDAIDQFAKKIGFQFGIMGAYYFHPKLSICAELAYELKGGEFANHEMKMDLHYASLPIYLKFNFTKEPEIFVYGGGYASYLLAAKTKGTYEVIIGDDYLVEPINENIINNFSKIDAGIVAGLGAQSRFNRWSDLFIDLRYSQGFIVLDNQKADKRYNFNYEEFWPEKNVNNPKNKAFMLTLGFIFYLDPR